MQSVKLVPMGFLLIFQALLWQTGLSQNVNPQFIAEPDTITTPAREEKTRPQPERNTVAILPFRYLSADDKDSYQEAMTVKLQEECYTILDKKKGLYKFQDPSTTNALLYRNGVDQKSIKGYTMSELAEILGVEFVIQGSLARTASDKINAGVWGTSTERNGGIGRKDKNDKDKKTTNNYGNTSVDIRKTYRNQLAVTVYNNSSEKIFSQDRVAMFNSESSYKDAMKFILKRSPIWNGK